MSVVLPDPVYVHNVDAATALSVYEVASETFVIICTVDGKAGARAVVEHCSRCAWATCFRLTKSGKWKELAPEVEED